MEFHIKKIKLSNLQPLLSLVLPSCMVVPIRDIGNKFLSTSTTTNSHSNMALQLLPPNMGMDIDNFISSNVDNYNDMRDHTMTSNKTSSRTISMSLSKVLVDYATKMK